MWDQRLSPAGVLCLTRCAVAVAVLALLGAAGCSDPAGTSPDAQATDRVQTPAGEQPLEVVSAEGHPLAWPRDADARPLVMVFINRTCPIANGYAPEIGRLVEHYAPRGVEFWLVYPEPNITAPLAQRHAEDYGYTCTILPDPSQGLTRAVGATMTPEAVVVLSDNRIAYRGRIDDQYADLGVRRPSARETDLRDALDAVLAGQPVAVPRTEAVGCVIEAPLPEPDSRAP